MNASALSLLAAMALTLAAPGSGPAWSQEDLGSLQIDRGGERIAFIPDEQPEYRTWVDRKGVHRLLAGWRRVDRQERGMIAVQLAGLADGDERFGLMILIDKDGKGRNYSAGCGPDSRKPCDPAALGLFLDRQAGTLTVKDAEFRRDTLGDGPEADERIRASGVLRLMGSPQQR